MSTNEILTLVVAIVSALAAIGSAIWAKNAVSTAEAANRLAQRNNSVSLTIQLWDEFNNPSTMLPQRRQAATDLSRAWQAGATPLPESDAFNNVADFFDTVGLWVRRDVLDQEMAWSVFWSKVSGYWVLGECKLNYVTDAQNRCGDATLWADFETLFNALSKEEETKSRHRRGNAVNPDDKALKDFLQAEIQVGLPQQ
jgi:hypothetical protein